MVHLYGVLLPSYNVIPVMLHNTNSMDSFTTAHVVTYYSFPTMSNDIFDSS